MFIKRPLKQIISNFVAICLFISAAVYSQANSYSVYIKTGNDYFNLFQYDKAFDNYRKATELEPSNWEAWYLGGKCLLKLKKLDDAERFLVKASNLNSTELDVQKALGSIYINYAKTAQTNSNLAAKMDYQLKACHAYPGGTKIWLALFDQWWSNGETEKIKKEGDFLVKKNLQIFDEGSDESLQAAVVYVARCYYKDGNYSKAEYYLNYAAKIRVQNDDLYSLKRELKNISENKIKGLLDSSKAEANKKNYEKAIELLQEASKQPGAHKAEIEESIERLERQINLNKTIESVNSLISKKNYDDAYLKLEEALNTYPEEPILTKKFEEVSNIILKIQEEKDKAASAKARAEQEELRKKQKIEFAELNANKLEKSKDYEEAINVLEDVIDIAPNKEEISKRIKSLKLAYEKEQKRQAEYQNNYSDVVRLISEANYEEAINLCNKMRNKFQEHEFLINGKLLECYIAAEKYSNAAETANQIENSKDKSNTDENGLSNYSDLINFAQGMNDYTNGLPESAQEKLEKVIQSSSKYKNKASSTIWKIRLKKWQWGIYISLIAIILVLLPKIKDMIQTSQLRNRNQKLEKIKESGNYLENLKFLEERFEKEDVNNMKLVTLLYSAALMDSKQYERSYDLILSYLKKDAKSPLAKRIAGETALALKETSSIALEHIQGLLKLNESRTDVINYLAQTYMMQKADHKLAQEFISKSISLNPGATDLVAYLADIIIGRQSYSQQTLKTFEKAIKLFPDKIDYYVALMDNYKALGNTAEADQMLEYIKQNFPDYSTEINNSYTDDPYGMMSQGYQQSYSNNVSDNIEYSNVNTPNNTTNQDAYAQQMLMQQQMFQQQQMMNQSNNQQQSSTQHTNANNGMFPDYDSIGSDEGLPTLESLVGAPDNNANNDYSDLIEPQKIATQQNNYTPQAKPRISGPTKNCPHCGALNAASEYYCTTCGKPF